MVLYTCEDAKKLGRPWPPVRQGSARARQGRPLLRAQDGQGRHPQALDAAQPRARSRRDRDSSAVRSRSRSSCSTTARSSSGRERSSAGRASTSRRRTRSVAVARFAGGRQGRRGARFRGRKRHARQRLGLECDEHGPPGRLHHSRPFDRGECDVDVSRGLTPLPSQPCQPLDNSHVRLAFVLRGTPITGTIKYRRKV